MTFFSLFFYIAFGVRVANAAGQCTWCGFRNGPQHTGASDGSAKLGTVAPSIVWETSLNASSASSLAFSDDGTLFVGGGMVEAPQLPYYGAGLYAFDKTGSIKWFFSTNDTVSGGPTISADGSSVIFGNDDSHLGDGESGFIYSVSSATGEEQWRFKTNG